MRTADRFVEEFDALVIDCFGDPGIRTLRELLSIPVTGPAEATIHTAAMVADRFTWLRILDETIPMSHEQVHEHDLSERYVSVRSVDAPVGSIDHGDKALVERMVREGTAAVEEGGAEALFPGCMCLSFSQRHVEIEERVEVPFLDPASLALEQAARWAHHGVAQSPKTYPEPNSKSSAICLASRLPARLAPTRSDDRSSATVLFVGVRHRYMGPNRVIS